MDPKRNLRPLNLLLRHYLGVLVLKRPFSRNRNPTIETQKATLKRIEPHTSHKRSRRSHNSLRIQQQQQPRRNHNEKIETIEIEGPTITIINHNEKTSARNTINRVRTTTIIITIGNLKLRSRLDCEIDNNNSSSSNAPIEILTIRIQKLTIEIAPVEAHFIATARMTTIISHIKNDNDTTDHRVLGSS